MIFWQGVSDPGNALLDQIAYYEEIRAKLADEARFRAFATMYLVPGLLHCGGATGPVDVPDRLLEKQGFPVLGHGCRQVPRVE